MAYTPQNAPPFTDIVTARRYIEGEFRRVAEALNAPLPFLQLQVLHREPDRPRDGMLAFADGTDWDPGAGAGTYEYKAGSWIQLF